MEQITEKKLKNQRFRKTEEAIIAAFFIAKETLSPERLLHLAKISRSTLYRHHKNIYEIAPNYEKYILRKCQNIMRRLLKAKRCHLRTLYQRLLIFMSANKLVMQFLLEYGNHDLIERIVIILKPKILATNKVADGEMFAIYVKEIVAIIEQWCRAGFNLDTISAALDKIMYLTNTAHIRLSPLASFNSPEPSTKESSDSPRY